MLQLENLVKDYYTGEEIVHAIQNISVTFRDCEFVSILGPSGCGKTTLLNVIGGLDNYNSGNLIINGKSTKQYTDKDWDTYRNHRVGFVFQSYNLIMHQSVLSNVELSMTLTGVSKEERRKRALKALEQVGLRDQVHKKPTQMSGGQMQRVAIARALVNDPEILLADEPTGALDSQTSVQIMDLLKEIAKDRLVIMVTHNPDLARQYSTRIIRLKDGKVVDDSDPVSQQELEQPQENKDMKKPSMRFFTALSLSFNNLLTKKGRTFLTAFAGSIGIIGIGLIMSLSNGMQSYIDRVETETMTSYPISIEDNTMDMSVIMSAMMDLNKDASENTSGKIESKQFANKILESISDTEENNLNAFRKFINSPDGKELRDTASAIEYDYGLTLHVYNAGTDDGILPVSPNGLMDELGMSDMMSLRNQFMGGMSDSSTMGSEVWHRLPTDEGLRDKEYELVDGTWPENDHEVVIEVDKNGRISDYTLYSLGLMKQSELVQNYKDMQAGKTDEIKPGKAVSFTKEELLDTTFTLVLNSDLYEKVGDIWVDQSGSDEFVKKAVENGEELKICGIIRPKATSMGTPNTMGGVYYTEALQDYIMTETEESQVVKDQQEHKDTNIFTNRPFGENKKMSLTDLTEEQKMMLASMSQDELMQYMDSYNENANATYASNMIKLGAIDKDDPTGINIYADTFEDKEKIGDLITAYNDEQEAEGNTKNVISYNDVAGTMMSGVSDIINIISYVLIAFVSVSLIVSSIMIGIITYISVLERVKEIGILRAMGASKRDVTRVFNAETFIIGLLSGILGIGLTVLLDIPISMVVENVTGVAHLAVMPVNGAVILVLVELVLTMIAGLIPARMAARKDPVEALRSE